MLQNLLCRKSFILYHYSNTDTSGIVNLLKDIKEIEVRMGVFTSWGSVTFLTLFNHRDHRVCTESTENII